VRELQRLLGKKTIEAEILKYALEVAAGSKTDAVVAVVAKGRFAMKAVWETLGVARSYVAELPNGRGPGRIGLEPRTTPIQSPQSNGMAEAFVRTMKRDYVRISPLPDARTAMTSLPLWIDHYNSLHPHKALGYRSPRESIADQAQP
jgi:hypothetical protein